MIYDNFKNFENYINCHSCFKKAFNFLLNPDNMKLKSGKYEIEGENIFALVQDFTTRPEDDCRLEGHQDYIDIQFILSGSEKMGFAIQNEHKIVEVNKLKDVTFYDGEYQHIVVRDNEFIIFFPHDLHKPCIMVDKPQNVKKIVLKVKL